MIVLESLNISNQEELSFVEKIYTESFPHSERRPFDTMIDLYNNSQKFIIQIAKQDNKNIGFLTFWDLGEFIFAEHFAIVPNARNEGVGAAVMNSFMKDQTKPIVLEVEIPVTSLAERRIGFYQRLGYKLWNNFKYHQPPYHSGGSPIPMYLMSWGEIDVDKEYMRIKELLYTLVYGY